MAFKGEEIMTYEDAEEIVCAYEKLYDTSCTCFQGYPPCSKCEYCPSEEDYVEALKITEEQNDKS